MWEKLINALGGTQELARALGIRDYRVVHQWRKRGVSWQWRPAVAELAATRKVQLPPNFLRSPKAGRAA